MKLPLNLNRKTCKVKIIQAGTKTVMADYFCETHMPIPRIGECVYLSLIDGAPMTVLNVAYKYEIGVIEVLVA